MTGASLIEFDCNVMFPLETGAIKPTVIGIYCSLVFGEYYGQERWGVSIFVIILDICLICSISQ
jgi:hypothetical protein